MTAPFFLLPFVIPVMVIDTGYNPNVDTKHKIIYEKTAVSDHGTFVVNTMLEDVCSNVVIYMCGYTLNLTEDIMLDCLNKADRWGVKYINISYSGVKKPSEKEKKLIKKLVNKGVKFTLASGNDGIDLDKQPKYPQNYAKEFKNIYVVGDKNFKLANKGSFVIDNLPAVSIKYKGRAKIGTSYSAPRYMNKLLKQECNNNGG
jgi:hypothetical protein